MSQDPFEALGCAGGFDMNSLLQQAQQMQEQMQQAQVRLAEARVEGTVAGGAVTVTTNGVGELVGVDIRAGQFDGGDADELADLGDLVVAEYRYAKSQADTLAGELLGPLSGGGLPGLPDGGEPGASGDGPRLGF